MNQTSSYHNPCMFNIEQISAAQERYTSSRTCWVAWASCGQALPCWNSILLSFLQELPQKRSSNILHIFEFCSTFPPQIPKVSGSYKLEMKEWSGMSKISCMLTNIELFPHRWRKDLKQQMDVKNETEYVRKKEVLRRIRIIKSVADIKKETEHFSIHKEGTELGEFNTNRKQWRQRKKRKTVNNLLYGIE